MSSGSRRRFKRPWTGWQRSGWLWRTSGRRWRTGCGTCRSTRRERAVRSAVAESLAGAATEGVAAVQVATAPLLVRFAGMTEQAGQADAALRGVVAWASWRLLGWMVAAVALLVLGGWLAGALVLWWDTGAIAAARAEKTQLAADVAEMQANRDEWAKAGLLAKLERCGPKARPCVRVNEKAGPFGTTSDYRVLLGY